jgi:hypothetical protein
MVSTGRKLRIALSAAAMIASGGLSGCGFDGVELNGAVFDYLGVSAAAQAQKTGEPQVAARPGIVLPPNLERLPEPGTGENMTTASVAWPDDPDERKRAQAADLDRRHDEFCREALWKARIQGNVDLQQIKGPKGACNPSVLRSLSGRDITTR